MSLLHNFVVHSVLFFAERQAICDEKPLRGDATVLIKVPAQLALKPLTLVKFCNFWLSCNEAPDLSEGRAQQLSLQVE